MHGTNKVSSAECHVQLSDLRRHISYTQKRIDSITTPGTTTHLFAQCTTYPIISAKVKVRPELYTLCLYEGRPRRGEAHLPIASRVW